MEFTTYAVPAFLAFVGLEALIGHSKRKRLYRLNDFVSGLSCGALDQIVNASVLVAFVGIYAALEKDFGLLSLGTSSAATWVLAFLAYDLAYYAFHRACHRVNFLWATHIVHHQSEEYNLTVSLRQGAIATWVTYAFYLPLALLGIPPETFLVVHGVYQIYQFFVHTRLVGRLGPLEWIFATPSLHRVHHGRTPECLDKNYGGFLNLWDRLFGSFQLETREPEYGITTGIGSFSPYWANLHYFAELARTSRRAPRLTDAVKVWLAPPEWRAQWLPRAPPHQRYDARPEPRWTLYLCAELGVAVVGGWLVLAFGEPLTAVARAALLVLVLAALASIGAFFDRHPRALLLEKIRCTASAVVIVVLAATGALSFAIAVPIAVLAVVSLFACVAIGRD